MSPEPAYRPQIFAREQPAGISVWRWIVSLLSALAVVAVMALTWLTWNDWNRSRAWVSEEVSQALGRPFAIRGALNLDWQWPQARATGWRRWIPGPTVYARDVLIGNPPDFPTRAPHFAHIGAVSADLALLPLLARRIEIHRVALTEPDVRLERQKDGHNNWTLALPGSEPGAGQAHWNVSVGQVLLSRGRLSYDDAPRQLSVAGTLDTLAPDASQAGRYGVGFEFSGWQGKAQIRGNGKVGELLSLRGEQLDFPVLLDARAGQLSAKAEGTIANPRRLSGVDFKVKLRGGSLADLYPLTGIVLPDTPAFATEGRLVGQLKPGQAVWDYQGFTGTVGQSDISGHVTYTSGEPRPRLHGQIRSQLLRLADLGPAIGATSRNPDKPKRVGKVLPDDPFDTARWDKMDLDLTYASNRIERPKAVPINALSVHALLSHGVLKLAPLDFGVAGGRFSTQIEMDPRSQPMNVSVRGDVRNLRLSALFPEVELMKKSLGDVDGGIALNAKGSSIASMAATANGEVRLYVRDGVMSQRLLDLAGLNMGSVVVSRLFGQDKEVRLRCAVADVPVRDGVAHLRSVKINTDDALIEWAGTADLRHEQFDLDIRPQAYQLKLFSLRTPLEIKGPFAKPKVGVKAGPLVVRAAAAVAALAAAPGALVLLPITVPGAEEDAQCASLLAAGSKAAKPGRPSLVEAPEHTGANAARPGHGRTPTRAPAMPAAGEFSGGAR
jgi:hypothetical protein